MRYRAVSLVDVFKYKPSTLVQAIVAILTFVGALISAWAGFLKAQDPTAPSFIYQTGFVVLLIALVGASWKLWGELHSP